MSDSLDVCQTGYDYEQFQINELENENMKLKEQLLKEIEILEQYRRKAQQQLDEANKLLKDQCSGLMDVKFYLEKWGVK